MSEDLELIRLMGKYNNRAKRTYLRISLLIVFEEKTNGISDDVCRKICEIWAASGLPTLQIIVQGGESMGGFKAEDRGFDRAISHVRNRFRWVIQLL